MKAFGPYNIIKKIGTGGSGVVYKARHSSTHRIVALKVLNNKVDPNRIKNEVRLHAGLNHSAITGLLDMIIDGKDQVLVMEYVDGLNLNDYIHQQRLTLQALRVLFLKILDPVEYLHSKNIIHRDLKPENIKVLNNGDIKLLDFGISQGVSSPKMTKLGHVVGTIQYAAPERFKNINKKQSDIWSLGIIYYEMLTGNKIVNEKNTVDNIALIRNEKAILSKLDRLTPDDKKIVRRCLKQKISARYQSINELKNDILEIGKPVKRIIKPVSVSRVNILWVIVILGLVALIGVKSCGHHGIDKPTVLSFQFHPHNAQLELSNGKVIKNGDSIYGDYGERLSGILTAPGYQPKNVIVTFSMTKNHDTLIETLNKK